MPPAPIPVNETERLAALRSYDVLDSCAESTFDNLVRLAAKLIGTPAALVSLLDVERQWFKARHGLDISETPRDVAFCAHTILNPNEPLVVRDATCDPRFADNPFVTGAPHVRFYAGMPLVNAQGFALGTLCVVDTVPRVLTEDQRECLVRLAEAAMTTLELRRAMNQARHLALTDALTGIPNRPAFLDAVDRAIAHVHRHGRPFAMLYLDLDGLKWVNDTFGHGAGDEVLRQVGAVLMSTLRAEDIAARLGGDEFGALLVDGEADGVRAAERVRIAIKDRMDAHGWPVTASVGVVTFPIPPRSALEAISLADKLLYAAKAAGRNRVCQHEYAPDEAGACVDALS